MFAHDGLAALLGELAIMSPRSRRAILGALSAEERGVLSTLAAAGSNSSERSITESSPFSPWLADRMAAVGNSSSLDLAASRMTPASRQALMRSAQSIEPTTKRETRGKMPPGKSLFDAFGSQLTSRKGRQ